MPNAALRPCSYPGCARLVKSGRCDLHQGEERYDPRRSRLYDRHWQKRRMHQLARQPWCEECLRGGAYVPATDVHHLVPHRGDRHIFMTSALESLCHSCHSRKTVKEQGEGAAS